MIDVNFNQKQWRQDFAAYVKEKLDWPIARVTRSYVIKKAHYDSSIGEYISSLKEFSVINGCGDEVKIQYYFNCTVGEDGMYYTERDFDLVYQYIEDAKKDPLWLLMSPFFYENKCNSGFISPDKDYYAFRKRKKLFRIYRESKDNFKVEIEEVIEFQYVDLKTIYNLKSIEEVQNTIIKYF